MRAVPAGGETNTLPQRGQAAVSADLSSTVQSNSQE
jgi:hypothetical protein